MKVLNVLLSSMIILAIALLVMIQPVAGHPDPSNMPLGENVSLIPPVIPAACQDAITVTNSNDSGAGSLRQALLDICPFGTITFFQAMVIPILSTLAVDIPVTIDGFTGLVSSPPATPVIVIDGQDTYRVFQINTGIWIRMIGLGIQNGYAGSGYGGGILNNGELIFEQGFLTDNQAYDGGGAIASNGPMTITLGILSNNRANMGDGGAIAHGIGEPFEPPDALIISTTIQLNTALFDGGAISNGMGLITIVNSVITQNTTQSSAGGIRNYNGEISILDSVISYNTAIYGAGGGVFNTGDMTIQHSAIISNTVHPAQGGNIGGGLVNYGNSLTIANTTISGNVVETIDDTSTGAGLYLSGMSNNLLHVTVANNTYVGAVAYRSETQSTEESITSITALPTEGAGIYLESGSSMTLANSIVANNGPSSLSNFQVSPVDVTSLGGNVSNSPSDTWNLSTDLMGANPLLGALDEYQPEFFIHPLLAGSPAIGAALSTPCSDPLIDGRDQRGVSRPQAAACDSGAFEFQYDSLSVDITALFPAVIIGSTNTVTMVVHNDDTDLASGVVATATLPAGVNLISALDPDCTLSGSQVVCSIGDLADGAQASFDFQLLVTNAVPDGATLTTTAVVSSASPETTPSDNNDSVSFVTNLPPSDSISIALAVQFPAVYIGGSNTVTMVVHNDDTDLASGVVATATLPAGVNLISALDPDCTLSGSQVVCSIGDLADGAQASFDFQLLVTNAVSDGATLTTTAAVSSASPETTPADNSDSVSFVTNLPPSDSISIALAVQFPAVNIGGSNTVTMVVHNDDTDLASGVVATATLPAGVNLISALDPDCTLSGSQVVCSIGDLADGAQASFDFQLLVTNAVSGGTTLTTTAVVSSASPETTPSDNNDSVSFIANLPPPEFDSLSVTLSVKHPMILIGASNLITMTIRNDGAEPAATVVVTATLPGGVNPLLPLDPFCGHTGNQIVCSYNSLASSAQVSLPIGIQTTALIPDGATLATTAEVSSSNPDATPTNNLASVDFDAILELLVYSLNSTPSKALDDIPGGEWGSDYHFATPDCGSPFLGEFSNQTVTLNLSGLLEHFYARSVFDLYIIRSWDGNQVDNTLPPLRPTSPDKIVGPDRWRYTLGGSELLNTTFTNWEEKYGYNQAYPGLSDQGSWPAFTGARAINSLCYTFDSYDMDAIYPLTGFVLHQGDHLSMSFTASGLQPIEDESWGLAALKVYIRALPFPTLFLPIQMH